MLNKNKKALFYIRNGMLSFWSYLKEKNKLAKGDRFAFLLDYTFFIFSFAEPAESKLVIESAYVQMTPHHKNACGILTE